MLEEEEACSCGGSTPCGEEKGVVTLMTSLVLEPMALKQVME